MSEKIFGGLIEFENHEKLTEFVETMDKTMGLKMLELSIDYGMKNGVYNLDEAYCLHKCISKLKEV